MDFKTKKFLGWSTIILISLIPVFLFFIIEHPKLSPSAIGRVFALAGITLFTVNFILSTRLRFLEEIFGGMDKVYLVHGITGGIAFILILAHPILMVAGFIPKNPAIAASFFIPGNSIFLDFGIIALLLFISLIFVTFFTRMRYNHWKFTHEFMGLIFIFALLHMFFGTNSTWFYIFASVIAIVGLSAFFYSLIVRKRFIKYPQYKIKSIKNNKDTISLELEPLEKSLSYDSGQFTFVKFYNEKVSRESHPFSIASKTNSHIIEICIKKLGDFTYSLSNLQIGNRVSLEGPYGKFNFKNFKSKEQIWLAGGIGITPFLGMIDELGENREYKIDLIYTFKDNHIVDKGVLDKISRIRNLKFIPWNSEKRGRITIGKIIESAGNIKDREILICGPIEFKEDMIRGLRELGIKRDKIHEEVFELK